MKSIIYLIVVSAFAGTKLFSVDVSIMRLSLYRLSLFAMIIYLILNNLLLDKKISIRIKDRQSLIIRFYFSWLIYSIYSLMWVLNLRAAIRDLFFIGTGFLCIWVFSTVVKNEKEFKHIFNIMFFMIVFHNLLGWFELQTGKYYFANLKKIDVYNQFSYNKAARVPVTIFSNVNDFATLMTFGVFISFIILLTNKKIGIKVLSTLTMVSSVLLIFQTGSRANQLGLLLGIIAVFILILIKRYNKFILITVGLILTLFVMIYPPLNTRIMDIIRSKIISRFGSNSLSVRSDMTRINLIKNGLIFLFKTLGFGTGVGNIEYWMESKQVFFVGKVFNIHNWWMEILVGYGIFIFISYVLIYIIKMETLFTAYLKSNDPFIRKTSLGLFGIMIAFVVSSISSSSNISTEWLWFFWAVLISFIGYIVRSFKRQKEFK